jgi:hypothetical protein
MTAEHLSIDCEDGLHDACSGRCIDCDQACTCECHVKAITREDVPQEDQFL